MRPTDWTAHAVSPQWPEQDRRPPLLRKEFELVREIERARLYVTARMITGRISSSMVAHATNNLLPAVILFFAH